MNTSSTRVELRWNLDRSSALSDAQKARARAALGSRLASDGTLRIVSSEYRSQLRNREAAEARFAATLRRALVVPRARRATKRPKRAQEARLEEKRKQSDRKKRRRWTADD